MWPQGPNCSLLTGMLDYLDDIRKTQSSALADTDKSELNTICESLNRLIVNHREGRSAANSGGGHVTAGGDDQKNDDEYSTERRVKKFFEWAQTYISITDSDDNRINWQQLVELFNFAFPHYAVPAHVNVETYHASFLCKYCKDKGNELMKNRKIKSAIEMYSKAIELLEREHSLTQKEQMKGKPSVAQHDNDDDSASETEANHAPQDDAKKSKEKVTSHKNEIAIIYCNRSAAYVYLQEYQKAVDDAVFALKNDPLLTKAWIRKGMAEQELKRYQIAYGDYQVALNQSNQSDNYYKFLVKKIKQCFDQILLLHSQMQHGQPVHMNNGNEAHASNHHMNLSPHSQ